MKAPPTTRSNKEGWSTAPPESGDRESGERERVEKGETFIWLLPAAGEVGAEDAFCFLFQVCVWALHTFIMHFVVHANACIELCKTGCVRVYWFPSLRVELSFTLCLLSLYKWMHICFSIWEHAYSVLNHQPRAHFLSCPFPRVRRLANRPEVIPKCRPSVWMSMKRCKGWELCVRCPKSALACEQSRVC